MSAMEQMALSMLQKMTGLSPEQMQDMAKKALDILANFDSRFEVIEKDLAEIRGLLYKENENGKIE